MIDVPMTEVEKEQNRRMEAKYGKRENPFPRRFDPVQAAVIKERQAVVEYLRQEGLYIASDRISAGKHLT